MRLSTAEPVASFLLLFGSVHGAPGGDRTQESVDLGQASLKDLMDITLTAVFKKEQKFSRTAAGIVVINQELAQRIEESAGISLVGQNLLRPRTVEYGGSSGIVGTQSIRSVCGKVTWHS